MYHDSHCGRVLCRVAAVLLLMLIACPAWAGVGREIVHVDVVWWDSASGSYVSARSDLLLLNDLAPHTVANFKDYIASGRYDATIIHRLAEYSPGVPAVIQGGGYTIDDVGGIATPIDVPSFGQIDSEWNAETMSNTRGTMSMARMGDDANSADSQWFINMNDANAFLDYSDDPSVLGFTTFGQVIEVDTFGAGQNNGMALWDSVGGVPTYDLWWLGGALEEVPLINFTETDYNTGVDPHFGTFLYTFMTLNPAVLIGDVNIDGLVNTEDINPFITALTDAGLPYNINADMNQDGLINTEDINPFINMLTATPPAGGGTTIPEPASVCVLVAGLVGLMRRA